MERDQAVRFMHDLLRAMVAKKASDLFITAGFPPAIKLDGKMTPVANQALTSQHTIELTRDSVLAAASDLYRGLVEQVSLLKPGAGPATLLLTHRAARLPCSS